MVTGEAPPLKPIWHPQALSGSVAVITGASGGIGAASASRLSQAGARVYALTRRPGLAACPGVVEVEVDASDLEAVDSALAEIARVEGRIGVAIANAASVHVAPFLEGRLDDWRAEVELNVIAALSFLRSAAVHMVGGGGGGSLIAVGSSAGERGGRPGHVIYGATKAALVGAVKGIARELGPQRIRANVVQPGATDGTAIAEIVKQGQTPTSFGTGSFFGRAATVGEVAHAIAFLASDASAYITGSVIRIDGGALYRDSH